MLSIKARDQASRQTRAVTKNITAIQKGANKTTIDFRKMGKEIKDMSGNTKKLSDSLKGLPQLLSRGAVGGGIVASIVAVIKSADEWAKTNASVGFTIASMGADAAVAFKRIEPHFDKLAEDTNMTEGLVRTAWSGLVKETGNVNVSIEDLAAVLNTAKVSGISVAEAASRVGQAMIGNVDPLRDLTGIFGFSSLAKYYADVALAAESTHTPFDEVTEGLKNIWEGIGRIGSKGDEGLDKIIQQVIKLNDQLKATSPLATSITKIADLIAAETKRAADVAEANMARVALAIAGGSGGGAAVTTTPSTDARQSGNVEGSSNGGYVGSPPPGFSSWAEWQAIYDAINGAPPVTSPPVNTNPTAGNTDDYWRYMAEGGVVTRATRAVIGEKGPEAVIPLDKMGGMGGFSQTIVLNNPSFNDEFGRRQVTRQINRLTREEFRRHGGAIA